MKDKITVYIFISYLFIFMIINIFLVDKEISVSEKRNLQQMPKLTLNSIKDKSFFTDFDKYTTDQIILRDNFKKLKTSFSLNILNYSDDNGYFKINNNIFKLQYPLNEKSVIKNSNYINNISYKYLNNNIYLSIIPDKNYYLNSSFYPKIDYNKMINLVVNNVKNIKYIDITNTLNIDDYYKTDPHWKNENILKIANKLINEMNIKNENILNKKIYLKNFYGSYYSSSFINSEKDNLIYLTNNFIENAKVNYLENKNLNKVYDIEKSNKIDAYDLYLSGAQSLISIYNDNSFTNRKLIIFRDSFASSLVPYLIPYYNEITLIDTRYISSNILQNYVDFNNKDILFLYSTLLLNEDVLK